MGKDKGVGKVALSKMVLFVKPLFQVADIKAKGLIHGGLPKRKIAEQIVCSQLELGVYPGDNPRGKKTVSAI